jgi:hypothetical protein
MTGQTKSTSSSPSKADSHHFHFFTRTTAYRYQNLATGLECGKTSMPNARSGYENIARALIVAQLWFWILSLKDLSLQYG